MLGYRYPDIPDGSSGLLGSATLFSLPGTHRSSVPLSGGLWLNLNLRVLNQALHKFPYRILTLKHFFFFSKARYIRFPFFEVKYCT